MSRAPSTVVDWFDENSIPIGERPGVASLQIPYINDLNGHLRQAEDHDAWYIWDVATLELRIE